MNALTRARAERGITQEGLAELAGVSRQTVHRIEAGSVVPSTIVRFRIATALNLDVDDLFPTTKEAAA